MTDVTVFDKFAELCPRLPADVAERWAGCLQQAAEEFGITNVEHQTMWVSVLCHECAGFTQLVENMNYSAQRLAEVWPSRYAVDMHTKPPTPNMLAMHMDRKPDVIASDVYANRMGNGPPASRDGWRFRGRYPCHLTGRNNYQAANNELNFPDPNNPDTLLSDILGMSRVSAWFWRHNNLESVASTGDFRGVSQVWNFGGLSFQDPIGWSDRQGWYLRALALIDADDDGTRNIA